MDTKERNRRVSNGKRPAENRKNTRAASSRAEARRRSAEAGRSRARQNSRVVKAPKVPKEPIPEVRYSLPKPFSKTGFVLKLVSVVAVVAAVLMCLSLFFRVEEVVVSGAEKYTPWSIMKASGVKEGDSLLSISDARISGKIISSLPYVKQVRVGIKLPGTVHIEVEELEMTYAIEARDGSWWLMAADGRIIEPIETLAASSYTRIYGVRADGPRADQQVTAVEDGPAQTEPEETEDPNGVTLPTVEQITGRHRLEVVLTILQALEDNGVIGQIGFVDVSNLNDIQMEYGQRLDIVLGTEENLTYKIWYMAQAITQLESYETGELDVSFKFSKDALLNPKT